MNGREVVVVRVGKRGLTDEVIAEIDNALQSQGVVKVKLMKNFRELFDVNREVRGELANELAKKLNASVVEIRGYTVVLRRPKRRTGRMRRF